MRAIVLILTVFYSTLSVGLPLNKHYCHNELVDVFLFQGSCGCSSNGETAPCCTNESVTVLFQTDVKSEPMSYTFAVALLSVLIDDFFDDESSLVVPTFQNLVVILHPPKSYLRFQQLILYA